MLTLTPNRLGELVAALRTLPHGLSTPISAGVVVLDTLRATGWTDAMIARDLGADLLAPETVAVVVIR
jgi:hypothetical protein